MVILDKDTWLDEDINGDQIEVGFIKVPNSCSVEYVEQELGIKVEDTEKEDECNIYYYTKPLNDSIYY